MPTSCPIIFAWDGRQFRCITDCLAVGGLGFAIGPGTYAPVVPRESVLFPPGSVAPREGTIPIKLHEPSEEITYLDGARLTACDLPPGWDVTVDERLVVRGPAATGRVHFYRDVRSPVRAINDRGEDVTELVRSADRRPAPPGVKDPHFLGRTAEHTLTLEFELPLSGEGAPVLVIDGWVEFPYSQTMFAASQAGADYRAPTLEACDAAGQWHTLLAEFGYPGGMQRQMSVPLPIASLPADCRKLRLGTNLEIYWDRVVVAWSEDCPSAILSTLALRTADLRFAGFPRRSVGPERQVDFDYSRRRPIEDVRYPAGQYTAFGDVMRLVEAVDDAAAVFGPGEEVTLGFVAPREPLPSGWTRRYVLEVAGWCKDRDLYTLDGETVGPLPARDPTNERALRRRDALMRLFNTRYEAGP